jgi:hypothetical protein
MGSSAGRISVARLCGARGLLAGQKYWSLLLPVRRQWRALNVESAGEGEAVAESQLPGCGQGRGGNNVGKRKRSIAERRFWTVTMVQDARFVLGARRGSVCGGVPGLRVGGPPKLPPSCSSEESLQQSTRSSGPSLSRLPYGCQSKTGLDLTLDGSFGAWRAPFDHPLRPASTLVHAMPHCPSNYQPFLDLLSDSRQHHLPCFPNIRNRAQYGDVWFIMKCYKSLVSWSYPPEKPPSTLPIS